MKYWSLILRKNITEEDRDKFFLALMDVFVEPKPSVVNRYLEMTGLDSCEGFHFMGGDSQILNERIIDFATYGPDCDEWEWGDDITTEELPFRLVMELYDFCGFWKVKSGVDEITSVQWQIIPNVYYYVFDLLDNSPEYGDLNYVELNLLPDWSYIFGKELPNSQGEIFLLFLRTFASKEFKENYNCSILNYLEHHNINWDKSTDSCFSESAIKNRLDIYIRNRTVADSVLFQNVHKFENTTASRLKIKSELLDQLRAFFVHAIVKGQDDYNPARGLEVCRLWHGRGEFDNFDDINFVGLELVSHLASGKSSFSQNQELKQELKNQWLRQIKEEKEILDKYYDIDYDNEGFDDEDFDDEVSDDEVSAGEFRDSKVSDDEDFNNDGSSVNNAENYMMADIPENIVKFVEEFDQKLQERGLVPWYEVVQNRSDAWGKQLEQKYSHLTAEIIAMEADEFGESHFLEYLQRTALPSGDSMKLDREELIYRLGVYKEIESAIDTMQNSILEISSAAVPPEMARDLMVARISSYAIHKVLKERYNFDVSCYESGRIKQSMEFKKGVGKHGITRLFHENGQLKVEAIFDNDKQVDGEVVSYHDNGQRARVVTLIDGVLQGEFKEWCPNGALKRIGEYINGEPTNLKTFG